MDKSNQGNIDDQQELDLDLEWVYLLIKAKRAGVKVEDVRQFFDNKSLQAI